MSDITALREKIAHLAKTANHQLAEKARKRGRRKNKPRSTTSPMKSERTEAQIKASNACASWTLKTLRQRR